MPWPGGARHLQPRRRRRAAGWRRPQPRNDPRRPRRRGHARQPDRRGYDRRRPRGRAHGRRHRHRCRHPVDQPPHGPLLGGDRAHGRAGARPRRHGRPGRARAGNPGPGDGGAGRCLAGRLQPAGRLYRPPAEEPAAPGTRRRRYRVDRQGTTDRSPPRPDRPALHQRGRGAGPCSALRGHRPCARLVPPQSS
jgi:hypothetical protein